MKPWQKLLSLVGVSPRENEEAEAFEARANALQETFPDDAEFVAEHLKAGNGVPEAVAAMKAAHADALAALVTEHATAIEAAKAEATASIAAITEQLSTATDRITQLETLPETGNEPIKTTVADSGKAPKALDHLTPAQAAFAANVKLPTAKKED